MWLKFFYKIFHFFLQCFEMLCIYIIERYEWKNGN